MTFSFPRWLVWQAPGEAVHVKKFGHLTNRILGPAKPGQSRIRQRSSIGEIIINQMHFHRNPHSYLFEYLQVEDLTAKNLTAAAWNGVMDCAGGVVAQLTSLGRDDAMFRRYVHRLTAGEDRLSAWAMEKSRHE